jgi:hypothetical protein
MRAPTEKVVVGSPDHLTRLESTRTVQQGERFRKKMEMRYEGM